MEVLHQMLLRGLWWSHCVAALVGCSFGVPKLVSDMFSFVSRFVPVRLVSGRRVVSSCVVYPIVSFFLCCCFLLVNGLAWCRFCLPSLVMSCRVVSFIVLFWYVLFPIVLSRFALLCCVVSSLVVSGLASRSVLYASLGGFIWLWLLTWAVSGCGFGRVLFSFVANQVAKFVVMVVCMIIFACDF